MGYDIFGTECPALPDNYEPGWFLPRQIANALEGQEKRSLSERARIIAYIAHRGQKRLFDTKRPYTTHLDYVADDPAFDEVEKADAYLHDVLEKTGLCGNDLLWLSMPQIVVSDVTLLSTKNQSAPLFDNLESVFQNTRCLKVKMRDIRHNSSDRDAVIEHYKARGERRKLRSHLKKFDFAYPLAEAFGEAIQRSPEWGNKNIVDFMKSAECPKHLQRWDRLKYVTSHPIPLEFLFPEQ